jgi:predicted DCC family thiol-disulfide oxidoreductase YuxK
MKNTRKYRKIIAKEWKIQGKEFSHSWISEYPLRMLKENAQQSIIVYYDDQCGLCSRWIRSLQKYGALEKVNYRGLSDAPKNIQKLSQSENAWVISCEDKNFVGYAGFVECMKQSKVWRFYWYIGNIPPLSTIGNIVYRIVSSRRKTCSFHKK